MLTTSVVLHKDIYIQLNSENHYVNTPATKHAG